MTKLAFHANAKLKKMDSALEDLCMKIDKDTKDIKHQYKMSRDKAKEIYNKLMDNMNKYKKAGGQREQLQKSRRKEIAPSWNCSRRAKQSMPLKSFRTK